MSQKQNLQKKLKKELLKNIQESFAKAIVYGSHAHYLSTDIEYRKNYAKKLGITDRKLRVIMKGEYNGRTSDVIAICTRNGMAPDLVLGSNKIKK